MKAVIMAGGEGTRLRPLTSNAPKPMLPLVNRPMMEHVIDLLKRHGIDEIVVTVAFMANSIRTYFGDGSELGVEIVYATEESPLGTAGSVRNAMDHLDERFLVISGDVLTDIDLQAIIDFHSSREALATIGLVHVENPLEFGIVITREDGRIERFLEKPTWGQVFSDTINTGIFVLEPEIFDHIAADRPVDFSSEVFPKLLAEDLPIYGAVAEGYWEDVGTLEAYVRAHKDILDGTVQVNIPGFELSDGVWLGEGTDVKPEAIISGPAVIGDNCRIEAGARIGQYTVLGANVRVRHDVQLERSVVNDNTYLGEAVRLRGAVIGRACDLRKGVRADEGVTVGDECFIGEDAHLERGGEGLSVQDRRGGGDGQRLDRVGVARRPQPVRPRRRVGPGQRRHHARAGDQGGHGLRLDAQERHPGHHVARLQPLGPHVEAGHDGRAQRGRRRRRGPRGRVRAGHPVHRAPSVVRRRHHHPPRERRPAVGDHPLLRRPRPRHHRGLAAQDRAALQPGGLPPGVPWRDRRHRLRTRALEHYATALESTVDIEQIRAAHFKVVIDYAFGSTSFAMPNVLAKLGLEVLAVNPFVSTAGLLRDDVGQHARQVADLVRASGSHLGAVLDPDGERLTLIDDEGHELTDTESLLTFLTLLNGKLNGDRVALPVSVTSLATDIVRGYGVEAVVTKLSNPALMDAATEPGVGFAGNAEGGFILPGFLPAFDAAASFIKALDLLAFHGQRLSDVVAGLPKPHLAHEVVVTPWEQKGTVMRTLVEQSKDREVELVDGVKVRHGSGWALALPDPQDPVTHVWAEATSDGDARRLAQEYARRIRQMVR